MEWKEKFPRGIKPSYDELLAFMPDQIREMFLIFNNEMAVKYQVYNKYPRYDANHGWMYGYCRNYRVELLSVTVGDGYFSVLGVKVADDESFHVMLEKAKAKYDEGYEERYARVTDAKRAGQIERTKARLEREKKELSKMIENIDVSKFNKCKWSEKLSRGKLVSLYQTDAKGIVDEELLDDVGYAFYARCKQAKDTRSRLPNGEIICHNCGAVLKTASYTSLIPCLCGYYYTYREYRRSFNAHNMPAGRAAPIFDEFADKWELCKSASEKMLLIDRLVHECHVSIMTGGKGRSVCVNLIEGTIAQLKDMLEMLANQ